MIRTCSSSAQRVHRRTAKIVPIAGGRVHWRCRSGDTMHLLLPESRLASGVLAIGFALIALAALQMLGLFEFVAGWSVLRNVSGWVGPAAAVGAAGAAGAAAAAGADGGGAAAGTASAPGGAKAPNSSTDDNSAEPGGLWWWLTRTDPRWQGGRGGEDGPNAGSGGGSVYNDDGEMAAGLPLKNDPPKDNGEPVS
jgi:hypothetical protein